MKKIFLVLILLMGSVFAQDAVFGTQSNPADNVVLTNAVSQTGVWIFKKDLKALDGKASLFVGGDSLTGTTGVVTVTYQLFFGKGEIAGSPGDSLFSEVLTLGTVAASLQKDTWGDGIIVGEHFDIGAITDWSIAQGVRFYFVGTGTHTTRIISRLIWR